MNLESSKIKVFPTSRRDDSKDRNARLNTEQNLISIVNRLTSADSFVIDGLDISTSGSTINISKGSCNIHGYYFEILEDITGLTFSNPTTKNFLCLKISTEKTSIHNSSATDNTGIITFEELIGYDSKNTYSGLEINNFSESDMKTSGSYFLPIAKYESGSWVDIENKYLKYIASDMQVDIPNNLSTLNKPQTNLQDFLEHLIIDDGELV